MNLKTFASSFVLSLLIIQSSAFSMSESEEKLLRQQSSAVSKYELPGFETSRHRVVSYNKKQIRPSKIMIGEVGSIIVDPNDGGSVTVKGWTAFIGKGPAEAIVAIYCGAPVALIPFSESSEHIATLAAEEGDQLTKADYFCSQFNAKFSFPDTDAVDRKRNGVLQFFALKDNEDGYEGGYIDISRKAFTIKKLLLDPKSTIEQDEPVLFRKLTDKESPLEIRVSTALQFPIDRQLEAFCTLLSDRDLTPSQRETIKRGPYSIPEKESTALETINDRTRLLPERLNAVRRLPELIRVRVLRNIIDEVLYTYTQYLNIKTSKEDKTEEDKIKFKEDKEIFEISFHNALIGLPQGKDKDVFLEDIVNEQKFPPFARFVAASFLPNRDELLFAFFKDKNLEVADRNKAAKKIKNRDLKIKWLREMIHNPDSDSLDRMFAAIQLDGIPIKDENHEDLKALIIGAGQSDHLDMVIQALVFHGKAHNELRDDKEAKKAEREALAVSIEDRSYSFARHRGE